MVSSPLHNNVDSGGGHIGDKGALPGKAASMTVLFGLFPEFFHKLGFGGFGAPEQPCPTIFYSRWAMEIRMCQERQALPPSAVNLFYELRVLRSVGSCLKGY
jgi:hypothetical protein